jgi:hypothetical protein
MGTVLLLLLLVIINVLGTEDIVVVRLPDDRASSNSFKVSCWFSGFALLRASVVLSRKCYLE